MVVVKQMLFSFGVAWQYHNLGRGPDIHGFYKQPTTHNTEVATQTSTAPSPERCLEVTRDCLQPRAQGASRLPDPTPGKGHARCTSPHAGHSTPPFPVLRHGLAHRNCPSLLSMRGLPTDPPSPPAWGLGNRSPQVHQEVRSLAQGENQTWRHDVEKHCFIFRVPSSLHFSISQNILCGLAGLVAARLPAAVPDVLRPPSAHLPTRADLTWQSPDSNDARSLLSRVSGSFDVSEVWGGPNSRQVRRSVFPS